MSNWPGRFPLKNRLVYSSTRPRAAPRWISPSPFISDTAPGCPRWAPWPRPLEMPCGERHGPVPRPSSLTPSPVPLGTRLWCTSPTRWDVSGTVSSEVTRGQQRPALGSWGLGQGEHEVSYLWPPAPSSSSSSSACSPCSPGGRRGRPEPGGAPPARGPRRAGGCWAGPRRTGWAAGPRWAPRGRALLWCETPAGSGGGELGRGAEGGGFTHQASWPLDLVVEIEGAGPSSPSTSYPITTTTTRGRRFPPAQPRGALQPLCPPAPGPGRPYLRCP